MSWDVDDADYNGDGVTDYRIPPIWEYGNTSAYRPFTDLSGDLAKVIRYIAIDMLFTPSPLYDPAASIPGPDGGKQIATDIFEGDPARTGLSDLHQDVLQAQAQRLEPYYRVGVKVTDLPLAGDALAAYNTAIGSANAPGCPRLHHQGLPHGWHRGRARRATSATTALEYFPAPRGHRRDPRAPASPRPHERGQSPRVLRQHRRRLHDRPAELHLRSSTYAPPSGSRSRRVPPDREARHPRGGALRRAPAPLRWLGLEQGHHYRTRGRLQLRLGRRRDGDPDGFLFGEGSVTFSWFDRDNVARWYVGRLLDLADTDAAAILSRPHGAQADSLLAAADVEFGHAVASMRHGDWNAAATAAVAGYRDVQRADAASGVTPASERLAELEGSAPRHPDRRQHGQGHAVAPRVLHSSMTGNGTTPILATPSGFSPE